MDNDEEALINSLRGTMDKIIDGIKQSPAIMLEDSTIFYVENTAREEAFRDIATYNKEKWLNGKTPLSEHFIGQWITFRIDELNKAIRRDPLRTAIGLTENIGKLKKK